MGTKRYRPRDERRFFVYLRRFWTSWLKTIRCFTFSDIWFTRWSINYNVISWKNSYSRTAFQINKSKRFGRSWCKFIYDSHIRSSLLSLKFLGIPWIIIHGDRINKQSWCGYQKGIILKHNIDRRKHDDKRVQWKIISLTSWDLTIKCKS